MEIGKELFGTLPDGRKVVKYILDNGNIKAGILNYGGIIYSLEVPDKSGKTEDIVLAHKDLEGYMENSEYLGAVIGRNSNRVSKGYMDIFNIPLEKNDGENNLHSGKNGLHKKLFNAETIENGEELSLVLTCESKDMEDDFPGNLSVKITYGLTCDNILHINYEAASDKDTVINLTNHSYFNLAGASNNSILSHTLEVKGAFYTPASADCVPTGEVLSVSGTPFDFTTPKEIRQDIGSDNEQLKYFDGYDHNFALSGQGYRKACTLWEPESGRIMDVFTDRPAIQLYTGNSLPGDKKYKSDAVYPKHSGLCLETQGFPNAINTPHFPSVLYKAGEIFKSTTSFKFYTK